MPRALILSLTATAALLLSSQIALAQVGPAGQDVLKFLGQTAQKGGLTINPEAPTDPSTIVAAIVNTLLGVIGVMFFVQLFYAGFRWMTAEGSEEIIKESKDTIRNSVIGITIVLSAFVLTNFVLNRLERINQAPAGAGSAPSTPTTGGCLDREGRCIGNYASEAECTRNGGAEFTPGRNC